MLPFFGGHLRKGESQTKDSLLLNGMLGTEQDLGVRVHRLSFESLSALGFGFWA